MAVNITFSSTEGGEAITPLLNLGSGGYLGDQPGSQEFYVRHDGTQPIINCRLFIAPFSGTYTGVYNAQSDYDKIIAGGDHYNGGIGNDNEVGYLRVSLDDSLTWIIIDSSHGAGLDTAISIDPIAANASSHIVCEFRFFNSIADTILGARQVDLRLTYTYTI